MKDSRTSSLVVTHAPERGVIDAYTPGKPGPGATAYLPNDSRETLEIDLYDVDGDRAAEGSWGTSDPAVAEEIMLDGLTRIARGDHPGCGWVCLRPCCG